MSLLLFAIAVFRARTGTVKVAALNAYRDLERGLVK